MALAGASPAGQPIIISEQSSDWKCFWITVGGPSRSLDVLGSLRQSGAVNRGWLGKWASRIAHARVVMPCSQLGQPAPGPKRVALRVGNVVNRST